MWRIIVRILNNIRIKQAERAKFPAQLIFFLTNRCNARCPHCFYWKELNKPLDELSTWEIEKIIARLDCRVIGLTGGEPTLRNDLEDIFKFLLKRRKIKTIILVTNGLMPEYTYKVLKKACDSTKKGIFLQLPIEGLKNTHEAIRGKGSFDKVMRTFELVRGIKNLSIYFVTTISRLNKAEVFDCAIAFSKYKNNLIDHKFDIARGITQSLFKLDKKFIFYHSPEDPSLLLSAEELESIYNDLSGINYNIWSKHDRLIMKYSIRILKEKRRILNCYAGKLQAVIYPNGDVAFCEFMKPFGNLRDFDYDFKKLWWSKKAQVYREFIKNCYCIHACNVDVAINYDEEALYSRIKAEGLKGKIKFVYDLFKKMKEKR